MKEEEEKLKEDFFDEITKNMNQSVKDAVRITKEEVEGKIDTVGTADVFVEKIAVVMFMARQKDIKEEDEDWALSLKRLYDKGELE